MNDDIKDIILSVFEASMEAQLRAIRRLRQGQTERLDHAQREVGHRLIWHSDSTPKKTRTPLHVSEK